MANIFSKAGETIVDTARDVTTKTADGMKNIAEAANQPTPLTPTPPAYVQSADTTRKTDAQTGEARFTHDYPFIRLTDENEPIEPGEDRLNPYVMRGRHLEFQRLAHILEKSHPSSIHLITGPPGYGKSTMLEMVKRYAQRIGFITVEIEPTLFADSNTLIEHIRGTVLGDHMAPFHTQQTTDAETGGSANANVSVKIADAGVDAHHSRSQRQTQERKGNPLLLANLRHIIDQLKQHVAHVRGLLFLSDEFQTITHTIQNDHKAYETARQNLYTLNEGFHRDQDKLPITTFLAGLTNAASTLEELLTRPPDLNVTELLPIDGYPVRDPDSTHCAQIIQDYILAGQKAHHHQLHIHPRDLYRWGANCQGHPVYANQAGGLIQHQLQQWHAGGKTTIQFEDIRALDYTIHNHRQTYYSRRIEQINKNKPNDIGPQLNPEEQELAQSILQHIMALIANQDGKDQDEDNPRFNTWNAMRHIAKALHPDLTVVQKCITKLEAIGAIRNMQFPTLFIQYNSAAEVPAGSSESEFRVTNQDLIDQPPHDPSVTPSTQHIAYVDCAIPSLTNYVLSQFPDKHSAIAQMSDTNQQALATFNQYLTTRWPWTRNPPLSMIPAYSAFSYNTPRTPAILTPTQAHARQHEIDTVIQEQHAHWERTAISLPWPTDMPLIPNDDPNQNIATTNGVPDTR